MNGLTVCFEVGLLRVLESQEDVAFVLKNLKKLNFRNKILIIRILLLRNILIFYSYN